MKSKRRNRICAWLIIVAMLSGMLPKSVLADTAGTQRNGLANYVVEVSSDPSTSTRPSTFGTASDDGRVWADKSVSANGTQFDVTLSALAQEYVRTTTTEVRSQAAADVAMVLDMSLSMTADRVAKMKNAVNKGIETIMAANPRNRIGIYYYSLATGTTSGNPNVGTLFPLASYSTPQTGDKSDAVDRYVTSNAQTITRKAGLTQKYLDGATSSTSALTVSVASGTATQTGLYTAINALIADAKNRQLSSADSERAPYVLLLTDGEANRAYPNWYNSPPNGTEAAGSGASGTAPISALTILTAAKLKDELKQAYSGLSGGKDVIWFNVAFGLDEGDNLATAILKPSKLGPTATTNLKSVYTSLTSLTSSAGAAYKKYGIGGTPGYVYANDYIYFVSANDLAKVDEAMRDLSGLVEAATQEKIIPFEQTNGSGEPLNLAVTDVLGAGMMLKTAPKLGGVTGTVKSSSGSVTTYGFADLNTTVVYNSATREVKWIIPPKEVPLITFSDRKAPKPGFYSNPNQLPVQLTYTVGLQDAYASGTLYSNEYAGAGVATATTRFIPLADNPYYYKDISKDGSAIVSNPKTLGSDIPTSVPKSSNATGTANASSSYEWTVEGADPMFITKLGNNGKIAPIMKIEMAPDSGSVAAGENSLYRITVTNLTPSPISNVIVSDVLPSGLTFVGGSLTEEGVSKSSSAFPYTISSVPAGGTVELTFKAKVSASAVVGTQYSNLATITSVAGTVLSTPASISNDTLTVANTFSPSVTLLLDGANYTGQSVALWKDGASKYTLAANGAAHSASGITPGLYDIYVNGENTGVQLSSSDASKVIRYYSVAFYNGAQKYDTPAAQTVLSGGKAVLPTAPTKEGYTFDKWITTDGGTTAFDFNGAITSTTKIYAAWTPNSNTAYTVNHYREGVTGGYTAAPIVETLNGSTGGTTNAVAKSYPGFTAETFTQATIAADGSTVVNIYYARDLYTITFAIDPNKGTTTDETAPKVRYEAMPTAPDVNANPGYEFTGWDKTVAPATDDETYTAQFSLTDFAITYNLDGGSVVAANPATYTVESTGITLNNPTKQGYTFAGWTGTGLSAPTTTVTIAAGSTGERAYVAHWTPSTNTAYTVNHYQEGVTGGYSAAPTVETLNGTTGGTTNAVAKSYPGFTAETFTQATIAADGSTVVNIHYTRNQYTISFVIDPNKGTTTGETAPKVRFEATPTAPDVNANPGYEFTGWDKTVSAVTDDETYTAQFSLTDFAITYNLDGGSVAAANPTTYTVESAGITLNNPTKPGYTFAGWTGTGLSDTTKTVTIAAGSTGERAYVAHWTPSTNTAYTVNHYREGVTGGYTAAPTVETLSGSTGGTTAAVAKTYPGFTAETFTQATIAADGSTVVNIHYARNLYTISFVIDPNKGTTTGETAPKVRFEATPTAPDVNANPGYEFTGWDKTVSAVTDNETYTAQFSLTDFSITYNLDGGSVSVANPATYTVESAGITLSNPNKQGYTFAGWTGTGLTAPTTTVTIALGSTGERAYVAHWTPSSNTAYTVNHYQETVDGGYSAAPTVETLNGPTGGTTNAVAKSYPGFTAETFTQATIAADGSTVVNIHYARNLYTISFVIDPNKGTTTGETAPKVRYEATPTAPDVTDQPGYAFTGWSPAIAPATDNETYTALFSLTDFAITYNLDGGSVSVANPDTYTVESAGITLNNPTKQGYTFAGWTGTGLTAPTTTVTIAAGSTGERNYVAHWTPSTNTAYTVNHYKEGVTGGYTAAPIVETLTGATGGTTNAVAKSYPGFTAETFAQATIAADGSTVVNIHYARNLYTITFAIDPNKGTTIDETAPKVRFEATPTAPEVTANPGYAFTGWDKTVAPATDNETYTAQFSLTDFAITYNLDGGSVSVANPATYTVESTGITLNNPTKQGYTFTGWTGTGLTAPTTTVTIASGSTGERAYVTHWTPSTNTAYTVNHYREGVGGGYTAAPTVETLSGSTGGTTNAVAKTYPGFTAETFTQATIAADGSTVVNIHYARTLYTISFVIEPNKGTTTGETAPKVRFEATPTAPDVIDKPGYAFTGWSPAIAPATDNETYTAQFSLTDFAITYNLDGGSVATTNPATYTVESAGITLNNPTKQGYTFAGWTGTGLSDTTKTVTIAAGSTGERSYVAHWTPSSNTAYTVNHYREGVTGGYTAAPTVETLNGTTGGTTNAVAKTYPGFTAETFTQATIAADGSTVVNIHYARNLYTISFVIDPNKGTTTGETTPKVRFEATPTAPDVTDQPGYAFTGWDKTIAAVTDDETYTAQFSLTDFAISYNLDGGSVATTNPATYTVESAGITLNNPTKQGYTFAGWTGTGLSGPTTTVTIALGWTGERSYVAHWTPSTNTAYTVNHYKEGVNGGYTAAPIVETLSGSTGGTTNAVAKTYPGFTAETFTQATIAADGSTVVNIHYARNLYTISFVIDPNKGTTIDETAPKVRFEATPTAPSITGLAGYTFTGWSPTVAPVTGDQTYTAQFSQAGFSITYHLDGGTVNPANPTYYAFEDGDFALINPTKPGYTFAGWTGTDLTEPTLTVEVKSGSTGDRIYTATWTANASLVTLDDNGGSGGSSVVTVTYGQPMPVATAPSQAGYTFVGYFDQPNGGTKYYHADMSSAKDWDKPGESAILYAVWAEIGSITIQYAPNHPDYGTVSLSYESLNPEAGTAVGSVATAKPGYRFVEWQDASGHTVSPNAVFVPQKDSGGYATAIYTAVFAAETYSITYNLDSGTAASPNPTAYTVVDDDFILTNPTKPGYTFAGWTGTGLTGPTLTVKVEKGSIGDRTYTATWQPVPSTGDYTVIGTVVNDETPPDTLPGATVEIVKGNTQYGNTAVTDSAGNFTIYSIPAGIYDLKITLGEKTAIIAVTIGGDAQIVHLGNIIFPYNASSELKLVGNDTPAIVIDNLHPEAVDYLLKEYNNTGFVKVEMTIEKIEESTDNSNQVTAMTRMNAQAQNEKRTIGLYLDMNIEKFYRMTEAAKWNSQGLIRQTNGLIQVIVPIPSDLQGKSGYTIYRYHDNAVNVIGTVPNADGEYLTLDQSDWTLTLYVKNFSVYAIAYNTPQVQIPPVMGGAMNVTITFNADGGTPTSTTQSAPLGSLLTKPADPTRAGYQFAGWYKADGSAWNFGTDKVYSEMTLTAKWIVAKPNIPALDKVNHFAYMKGYPDKTFGPQKNMTRAEVAVMFARLLVEKMEVDQNYPSSFKDVDPAQWYANAIGYMEQHGIITGYSDGTFRPNAPITRAEFAAIASRFDELVTGEPLLFTDVTDDYWARDSISFAASKGWIKGYPDGTFKPGNNITRAEVVSLVNRMLERSADRSYVDSWKQKLNQYVDLANPYWAYYEIMEATNGHEYDKTSGREAWKSHTK
ncbi:InlB B-repeat-containing protein [Gorillibacterium sp. sgz500922]|uniref:InlB B-repeat-containing protein n=1 Tax=Gorillibacterium sp. sgz500922 TaxID=3446694 RepID=UPI003F67A3C5